jgi:hypothetical protein
VVIYTDCTGRCTIGRKISPITAKKIKDMLPCDERKTTWQILPIIHYNDYILEIVVSYLFFLSVLYHCHCFYHLSQGRVRVNVLQYNQRAIRIFNFLTGIRYNLDYCPAIQSKGDK